MYHGANTSAWDFLAVRLVPQELRNAAVPRSIAEID